MKIPQTLAALLGGVLTLLGLAAAAAPTQASNLFGMTAVDGRNKRIGVLTDFVADLQNGPITGVQVGHATADGMAHEIYPLSSVQIQSDKVVVRGGAIGQEIMDTASVAKSIRAPLKDADGKNAGEISDVMVDMEAMKVTAFLLRFDPKWLDMQGEAAVGLKSVERQGDAFLAKFSASDVRPSTPGAAKPSGPPPPPAVERARLSKIGGTPIVDVSGKAMGTVDDVQIDVAGRKVAAVVIGGQAITFPQPALQFDKGKFIATAALDGLAKAPAGNLANARSVLGTRLTDPDGAPAGKVEDIIVDMANGNLKYFVGSFDPSWVAAGWFVTLPMRAITNDKSGQPVMRVTLNEINLAFLFQNWPDFADPATAAAVGAKLDH